MKKFKALLQLLGAILLHLVALACVLNIVFISTRPETISVVNAMIGLGLIAIFALAMGRIQWRKGLQALRAANLAETNGTDS